MTEAIEQIAPSFSFAPFAEILHPHIEEVLAERGLTKFRKGTCLVPKILIWLVLAMTIRRDLDYHQQFPLWDGFPRYIPSRGDDL
jgi:hypothetical protein